MTYMAAKKEASWLTDRQIANKFCVTDMTAKKAYQGYAMRILSDEDVELIKKLYEERCRLEEVVAQNSPGKIAYDLGVSDHWVKRKMRHMKQEMFP